MAIVRVELEGEQKLQGEFRRLGESLSSTIAHYAADRLTEQANKVLADYYADYDPIEYSRYNHGRRTEQLLNSAKRYYNGNYHLVCEGGVRFAYETLHYPNKGADSYKTTASFWDGSHGGWCPMRYEPGVYLKAFNKKLLRSICHGSVGRDLVATACNNANLRILSLG